MGFLGVRQKGTKGRELVATLTAQDRCDRCPAEAQAVVLLTMVGRNLPDPNASILLFCNHHLNIHEPALAQQGASVYRKEKA